MRNLTSTANVLRQALQEHNEWLLDADGKTFSLQSNEILVDEPVDRINIKYLDDSGFVSRTVDTLSFEEGRISIEFQDGTDGKPQAVRLVPRVLALELRDCVETARLETANSISTKLSEQVRSFKPLRVSLNEHSGRFAEIFAQKGLRNIAVLADVSGVVTHEAILSKAFVWLRALSARKQRKIEVIWIVSDKKGAAPLRALLACLKREKAERIRLWQPARPSKTGPESVTAHYTEPAPRTINSLWSGRLPRLGLLKDREPTHFASELLARDGSAIDRIFSAKGETLRYKGLPFARTRVIGGEEKVWLGIEQNKILREKESNDDLEAMIQNLTQYRRHDSPNKQHEYYRGSPEAWLESILRRNIRALDSNLILSPIYNQFRTAREKIDLLALRCDGRLVIIELKIAPDRDMVFQAVDYWRKVESQRRRGNLNKARLFGDAEIADRPTVVYLAAPTLGFHADTAFLAEMVSPDIEIFRFDLAENWRERVSVLRRRRL